MDQVLLGKIALVTGAARGIGRATALAFAHAGADVIGADIAGPVSAALEVRPSSPDDLAETGTAVREAGRRWLGLRFDQRDIASIRAMASEVRAAFGGLDILFANAGVQGFKPLLEMTDEDWRVHIDVNLTGTANVFRVFAPMLVERGGGRIIATSSTQGRHGTKFGAAYSASKWGIIGLVKSAALELAEHGVTVNAVIPGLIDTPLTRHEQRYAQVIEVAGREPTGDAVEDEFAARAAMIAKTPLRVPWIDPAHVAPVVVFLASDAACMVTGAAYDVTAGDSANLP